MPPVIHKDKCNGCGKCVLVCSEDVFFGWKNKQFPPVAYPDECWHCTACLLVCPIAGAISLRTPLPMMVPFK
ncbi:MAG: ferredoxin family protein [Burkholderiales bacterium]|nr:ferredoxin family protein [Burkholderiales bacterium]